MSVELISSDGFVFDVDYNAALLIGAIKRQLKDGSKRAFSLPTVSGQILKKVISFIKHNQYHPMRSLPDDVCTNNIYQYVDKWHGDFIMSMDYQGVFEMILAAQDLDIMSLFELACARIAPLVLWKTPQQIRDTFNIEEEFTPEQEALIHEENRLVEFISYNHLNPMRELPKPLKMDLYDYVSKWHGDFISSMYCESQQILLKSKIYSNSETLSMAVVLESSQGDALQVDYDAALMLGSISEQLKTSAQRLFTFPKIESSLMKKVASFIMYHQHNPMKSIEKPIPSNNIYDAVEVWDADYITELDIAALFDLILAANQLGIKSLEDLGCAAAAALMKGKTLEEIRETFQIPSEFTPEEEKQICQHNRLADGSL
ncbi:S-phase kinase-associated protein 1A [Thraustotheca clavata]|uniref:S-phase kinase-associated protein 1A n=1 Tax=Thraustotheca clavata TaxID=74557 RepID=A0A1V9ZXU0_9STRA|nr:S-phase kinase-associated protein 1A [Thraustotheca clavata]